MSPLKQFRFLWKHRKLLPPIRKKKLDIIRGMRWFLMPAPEVCSLRPRQFGSLSNVIAWGIFGALWDGRRTRVAEGFTYGDGWYEITDEALSKIRAAGDRAGWYPELKQMKEKMGALVLYFDDLNGEMQAAVDDARRTSRLTCELCGQPGTLHGSAHAKMYAYAAIEYFYQDDEEMKAVIEESKRDYLEACKHGTQYEAPQGHGRLRTVCKACREGDWVRD